MHLRGWIKRALCSAAALSLFTAPIPSLAANDTYASYVVPSYEDPAPIQQPVWTDAIEHAASEYGGFMAAGGGNVFYLKNSSIIAAKAADGKRQWKFGSGLKAPILYHEATVYVMNEQGTLYALDAKTGSLRWSAPGDAGGTQLVPDGDRLFVGLEKGLANYDLANGKLLWKSEYPQANYAFDIYVTEDAVLQMYSVSGAITHGVLRAIDKDSGKPLWRKSYFSAPLAAEGGAIYAKEHQFMIEEANTFKIHKIDVKSGELIETRAYLFPEAEQVGRVLIDGEELYVEVEGSLYRYHRDADPERTTPAVISFGAGNTINEWIAGPYAGRYFYLSGKTYLSSYHPGKQLYTSYGVNNPISRLELHGSGVYVGQTDGQLKVFQLDTGKTLLRAKTDVRVFEDFIIEGDMLLVQAEKQLLAFKVPAAARKAAASSASRPQVREAEANLVIGGKEAEFHPAPVFVNNRIFVPFRSLFTAVGATVQYDAATKTVTAVYGETKLTFRPNESLVQVNGSEAAGLSEPSFLHHDTVYIPLRDVGSLLGANVTWHGGSRTVTVNMAGE
jgi:outer membrane protein assembly factor BamB